MLTLLLAFSRKYFSWLVFLTVLFLLAWAWTNRFMEDDAFISFRYADNLVRGNGLVWNTGEYVEGYTNFLWTLMISVPLIAGWNPAIFSQLFGLCWFLLSLFLIYRIAERLFASRTAGLLAIILLGSNYTFNAFATSGLETQMQAALILAAICLLLRISAEPERQTVRLLLVSILTAASILTRLDSALPSGILLLWGITEIVRAGLPRKTMLIRSAALAGPAVCILAVWFSWKLWYYGNILPNTYYAKIASPTSAERGVYYLYSFMTSYLLLPFLIPLFLGLKRLVQSSRRILSVALIILAAWTVYLVRIGGDHMEFRFMVPVLPFVVILLLWMILELFKQPWLRWAGVMLILAGTVYHTVTFAANSDPDVTIYPLHQFGSGWTLEEPRWAAIGKVLRSAFPDGENVKIATTAAGAIPYYSRLPSVDMLGINDAWVARYGVPIGTTPGHQRMSPMSYLVRKQVNLVIAHPVITTSNAGLSRIPIAPMDSVVSFTEATFLSIPIDSVNKVVVLYLLENSTIDDAITRNHWTVFRARLQRGS